MDQKDLEEDSDLDSKSEEGESVECISPDAPTRYCIAHKVEKRQGKNPSTSSQQPANKRPRKSDDLPSPTTDLSLKFENWNLDSMHSKNVKELKEALIQKGAENLQLTACSIEILDNDEVLPAISSLKRIIFNNCKDNIFKIFTKQESLEQITVINEDRTWTGFPHKVFNEICENCPNLNHIVLIGAGTGSYFNCDDFPYKITKLETTMITFNWYVGIDNPRVNFLESQIETLEELTIHELPYDYDGGKVLKYIIEKMSLKKFYYGNILLILDGEKQDVKELAASQIQITSAFEMIRQFPSITKFKLTLSNTDISSDDIEKIINPSTDIFNKITEFEVIDNSSPHRGLFGLFLGLYKNLKNIHKLTIKTKSDNINTILKCLPIMSNLLEIELTSTAPNAPERYKTLRKFAENLKILRVPESNVNEAQEHAGGNVEVAAIGEANAPGGLNVQRADDEAVPRGRRDDDDDDDDDSGGGDDPFAPLDDPNHGTIETKIEQFPVNSSFEHHNINNSRKLYIHAFAYYKNLFNRKNRCELIKLIGDELYSQITSLMIEERKITVIFRDNDYVDDFPTQFKIKMDELAFRQHNKHHQLHLLTISIRLRIELYCIVDSYMKWNYFMLRASSQNGLSGSLWEHRGTVPEGDKFKIKFLVDGIDYSRIQGKRNILHLAGNEIQVNVVVNPFQADIDNLIV